MRRKVVLVRPPSVMKGSSFIASQFPLNIASIAAFHEREGGDVEIWDYDVEKFDETTFQARVRSALPGIVGISAYTPTILGGHRIAKLVKEASCETVTVVGGPHLSALPEDTMREFPAFDYGIRGEAEIAFHQLARCLQEASPVEGIIGLVRRCGETIVADCGLARIDDLDMLPPPARHMLRHDMYRGQSHRGFSRGFLKITEMMTSRGCPNRCIFCASDVVAGRGVRFRSAASVEREIIDCVERYGFNHFTISDDTFALKEDRLSAICGSFRRKKVTWNCNARVHPISRKMLDMMVASGCTGITFGVESGSPRILELIDKRITTEQIEHAFRLCHEAGVKLIEADVIIGSHPSETRSDLVLTERLLRRIAPDIVMVSVVVPYPGTELYRLMKASALIDDRCRWDSFVLYGQTPNWRTEHFSAGDLVNIQKGMLRRFYARPAYVMRTLSRVKSISELSYWVSAGFEFFFGRERCAEAHGDARS